MYVVLPHLRCDDLQHLGDARCTLLLDLSTLVLSTPTTGMPSSTSRYIPAGHPVVLEALPC